MPDENAVMSTRQIPLCPECGAPATTFENNFRELEPTASRIRQWEIAETKWGCGKHQPSAGLNFYRDGRVEEYA